MEDEQGSDEPTADADVSKPRPTVDSDPVVPKSEFERVISQRQELKQKTRELEARLSEYEAAEKATKQAKLREAEQFAELEKDLRADLQAKEAAIAQAEAAVQAVHKQYRREAMLGALADKTGQGRYVLAGLLANAEGEGLEVAPEQVDDKAVETLLRHFKKQAPELFKVESRGGSSGTPVTTTQTRSPEGLELSPEGRKYFEMGQRMSNRR